MNLFNFFKKSSVAPEKTNNLSNHKFIGCVLAYEVARSDGNIDNNELGKIKNEIINKSKDLGLDSDAIFATIEMNSNESISFNDFINLINKNFSLDEKEKMIKFLWETAYSDNILEVNEERLIRRIADMINLKDVKVLKLKSEARNKSI